MRRKSPPTPQNSSPPKRRRTNPVHNWYSHRTELWAHAEWFMSLVDAPFFSFSEFEHIMTMAMNLSPLRERATRLQFARVRAAMCNAIPGRFVQPRRLSSAFLAAEVDELNMYRTDARRMLRGLDLLPATDPTTMTNLRPHWWSRYRCPPPQKPSPETPIFVRTIHPPPPPPPPSLHNQPHFNHSHANVSLSSTPPPNKRYHQRPNPHIPTMPKRMSSSRLYIRPAVFLSLEDDTLVAVRFADDHSQQIVNDLDVMLMYTPQPTTPAASIPPTVDHSPLSSRLAFSPQPFFDPLAMDTPRVADEGLSALAYLYSSPRPVLPSPIRPALMRPSPAGTVECEVDTRQIAESMRLLDRKAEILFSLRKLNEAAEAAPQFPQPPHMQQRVDSLLRELSVIGDDLRLVLAHDPLTPVVDAPRETLNFNSPEPRRRTMSMDHAPVSATVTPDGKNAIGDTLPRSTGRSYPRIKTRIVPAGTTDRMVKAEPRQHIKPLDFENVNSTRLLAQILTRAALANLPDSCPMKSLRPDIRTEIMDCVSACVTVLIRARATRDFRRIEQVVEAVPVKSARNAEALEAIHTAARAFESTSTDSI